MKIAVVIANFPKRSETFVSREVLGLERLGFEVEVISFAGPGPDDESALTDEVRALTQRVHYVSHARALPFALRPRRPGRLAAAIRLNDRFRREATRRSNDALRLARGLYVADRVRLTGCDRIHAHWAYGAQVATLAAEVTGLPLGISIHAHEVAHEAGHLPALFERASFAAFCNDAAMGRVLETIPAASPRQCHLIYHGVDLSQFVELPPAPQPPPLRIVTAGRLTKTKGFDRLLRAVQHCAETGVEVAVEILGDGPELEPLRKLADDLGLADRVSLPGWVRHDEVRDRLGESHAFALLANTNFHDGLPNVVLEAMASARPVIVSPFPAAREAIEEGVSGFVLDDVDDYAGFARVAKRLSNDLDSAARVGGAGAARARARFDDRQELEKLAALIRGGG